MNKLWDQKKSHSENDNSLPTTNKLKSLRSIENEMNLPQPTEEEEELNKRI